VTAVLAAIARAVLAAVLVAAVLAACLWTAYGPQGFWTLAWTGVVLVVVSCAVLAWSALPQRGGPAPPGLAGARQAACLHGGAVEVRSVTGELVAWLCLDCDAQLGAGWRPPRCADCAGQLGHPSAAIGRHRVCLACARKIIAYGGYPEGRRDG
jgi:hypothetical protein